MTTPINPLPTPPSPADSPADFNTRAFALLGALPAFVTEANAQASGLDAAVASAGLEADAAALKAGEALTSANNAALSKTGADSARNASVAAKNAAEAALDSFDDRYLGAKASAPAKDNDGGALLTGALYWDTALPGMRSWSGSAWVTLPAATAAAISNTPAGSIAATTVQAALNELDSEKVATTVFLPSGVDLGTVVTSGFYRMSAVSNGPVVSVDYGQLIVSRGADTITQIAIGFNHGRMFTRSGDPSSVGGGGAFSPWREVYTSASILGTVSQSAGVPTGAVIERGSNANGEYVRFADGTQICYHKVSGGLVVAAYGGTGLYQSSTDWTLPAGFAGYYVVTGGGVDQDSAGWVSSMPQTTPSANFAYISKSASHSGVFLGLTAIGRWF